MRNKLISLLIVLCMIISYTVVPAFAEQESIGDTASIAYDLLVDIGVVDNTDTYESIKNQKATRGQFALYLSRVFDLKHYGDESIFGDVSADTPTGQAVLSLASAGIIGGYGDGTARPEEYISIYDISIMTVKALGYKVFEAWTQDDYRKFADTLDLFEGIKNSTTITVGDIVVILYNVLHTNCVIQGLSSDEYGMHETSSPLEQIFGLKYVKGVVTDNAYTSFSGTRTSGTDVVGINDKLYITENESVKDMLGYMVIAYQDIETEKIKYCYYDTKNGILDVDAKQSPEYYGSYVEYTKDIDGTRKKKIEISSDVVIIKNSIIVETDYESAFEIESGNIRFISHNNGSYNVVLIEEHRNYIVTSVDVGNRIIYTSQTDENGNRVKFDLEDTVYVDIKMLPNNKSVNENLIEPEDLLCLSVSDDGQVIRGYLCENSISGKVEGVTTEDGETYIVVDGKEYEAASDFLATYGVLVGMSGSFVLDIYGKIAMYSQDNSYVDNIGYVYKVYYDDNDDIALKIYGLNKQHIRAPLARKVRFDGQTKTPEQVKTRLCTLEGGQLQRQLVVYKLNDEGEISQISTAKDSKSECTDGSTLYTQLPAGNYKWYYQMKTFERKYVLSGNTYYMRVPAPGANPENKALYGCQSFSNVSWYNSDETKYIQGLYKFNDDVPYADILLVGNTDGTALTKKTEVTVVSSVKRQMGPDNELVVAVRGYRTASEVVAYFPVDEFKNDIDEGDIIRFVNNVYGMVSDYEVVYDYSEDQVMWDTTVATANEYTNNTTPSASPRYTFGYVNKLYIAPYVTGLNSVVQIGPSAGVIEDTYQTDTASTSTTRFVVVDSSRVRDKVYMASFDQITSYEDSGTLSDTSRLFVHTSAGWLKTIIIYK